MSNEIEFRAVDAPLPSKTQSHDTGSVNQSRVMLFKDYLDIQIRCFEGYYKTECTSIDVCLIKVKLDEIMRINGVTIV